MNIEASFFSSLTVWFYRFSHSTVLGEIKAAICTTVNRNAVGVFSVHLQWGVSNTFLFSMSIIFLFNQLVVWSIKYQKLVKRKVDQCPQMSII